MGFVRKATTLVAAAALLASSAGSALAAGPRPKVLAPRVTSVPVRTSAAKLAAEHATAKTTQQARLVTSHLASNCTTTDPDVNCTFYVLAASVQSFNVPAGVRTLRFTLHGATSTPSGGNGGLISGSLPISSDGTVLDLQVGENQLNGAGGYPDGGTGHDAACGGAGSTRLYSGYDYTTYAVAGGGGGCGGTYSEAGNNYHGNGGSAGNPAGGGSSGGHASGLTDCGAGGDGGGGATNAQVGGGGAGGEYYKAFHGCTTGSQGGSSGSNNTGGNGGTKATAAAAGGGGGGGGYFGGGGGGGGEYAGGGAGGGGGSNGVGGGASSDDLTESSSGSGYATLSYTKSATSTSVTATSTSTDTAAPVTLSSTVSVLSGGGVAEGLVSYADNGNAIPGCTALAQSATCATTLEGVGENAFVATYLGDDATAVSSGERDITSQPTPTTTTLGQVSANSAGVVSIPVTVTPTDSFGTTGGSVTVGTPVTHPPTCVTVSRGQTLCFPTPDTINPYSGCGSLNLPNHGVGTAATVTCSVSESPGTALSIAAQYADTSGLSATSTSATNPYTVPPAQTKLTLTSSAGVKTPATFGDTTDLVASIIPTQSQVPGGTVAFTGNTSALATGTLAGCAARPVTQTAQGYQATCLGVPLYLRGHDFTATYSGDAHTASAKNDVSVNVRAAATTTLLSATAPNPNGPAPLQLSPTVAAPAGAPVTLSARVTYSTPVGATLVGGSPNSGSVKFIDTTSGSVVCQQVTVTAASTVCVVPAPSTGDHTYTAQYTPADRDDILNSIDRETFTVAKGTGGVALTVVPATVAGQPYSLTATLTPPGGSTTPHTATLTFRDGTTVLCAAPLPAGLTGSCSFTPAPGAALSLTAEYAGDTDTLDATSAITALTAPAATATAAIALLPATPRVYGTDVTATVAVGQQPATTPAASFNGRETVSVSVDGTVVCAAAPVAAGSANTTASCDLGVLDAGSHTVTATFNGGSSVLATDAAPAPLNLTSHTTTTTLGAAPTEGGAALSVTVTGAPTGASPTGTVTISRDGVDIPACDGLTLTGGSAACTDADAPAGTSGYTATFNPAGARSGDYTGSAGKASYASGDTSPCSSGFASDWALLAANNSLDLSKAGVGTLTLSRSKGLGGCTAGAVANVSASATLGDGLAGADVTGTLSQSAGLCLTSGQLALPADWHVSKLAITQTICFPIDDSGHIGLPTSGALHTVSDGSSPFFTIPGVSASGLLVSFGPDAAFPSATLTASTTVGTAGGAGANLDASIGTDGSVTATVSTTGLTLAGQALPLTGTISRDATGKVAANVSASLAVAPNPPIALPGAPGLTVHDLAVSLGTTGLVVAGAATIGSGSAQVTLTVAGTLTSLSAWSLTLATASPAPVFTPAPGLSLAAAFTGTISDAAGSYTLSATAGDGTTPLATWAPGPGVSISVNQLTLGAGSPACAALPDSDGLLGITGTLTLGGLNVSTTACADLRSGGYALSATQNGALSPVSGLTLTGLTMSLSGGNGAPLTLSGSAQAAISAGGHNLSAAVTMHLSGGVFVVLAPVDLTSLGVPISNGYVAYASAPIPSFDTSIPGIGVVGLPAGLSGSGTLTLPTGAASAATQAGFSLPANDAVTFSAALSPSAVMFTAALQAPGSLPFLTLPGGATLSGATLAYQSGQLSITASGTVANSDGSAAPVSLNVTVASDGSFSGSAGVSGLVVFGQTLTVNGALSRTSAGVITAAISASIPGPVAVGAFSASAITVTLGTAGLSAAATVALGIGGAPSFQLTGNFSSLSNYSLALSGTTGSWTIAPGAVLNATLTGTFSHTSAGYAIDLLAAGSNGALLSVTPASGVTLAVTAVELSNGTAPSGCDSVRAGDLFFAIAGSLSASLEGTSGSGTGNGCIDLTHPGFDFTAAVPALNVSAAGGNLTLSNVALHIGEASGALTIGGSGQLTVTLPSGGSISAAAILAIRGSTVIAGISVDLSATFGSTAASASVFYASAAVSNYVTGNATLGTLNLASGVTIGFAASLPASTAAALTRVGINLPAGSSLAATVNFDPSSRSRSLTLSIGVSLGSGVTIFSTSSGTSLVLTSGALQLTLGAGTPSFAVRLNAQLNLPPATSGGSSSSVPMVGLLSITPDDITASLSITAPWVNAFGVTGLTVASAAIQGGISFEGTPSLGFAATVTGLPSSLATDIGYQQGSPITIALNISVEAFLLDLSVGVKDSGTPALEPLAAYGQASVIEVDYAEIYISPLGATIGTTTYPPGFALVFQGSIFGVSVDVDAEIDPTQPSISFVGTIGVISVGSLQMGPTTLIIQASPHHFKLEFDGAIKLGPGTVNVGPLLRFTGGLSADVRLAVGSDGISAHADIDANVTASNNLPQSACYYGGVLPYPCNYHWVDDTPLVITLNNLGFDINSSGLTIDIPNTTSSVTLPFSSNIPHYEQANLVRETAPVGRRLAAPEVKPGPVHATLHTRPQPRTSAFFSATGQLREGRAFAGTAALSGGRVLLIGGADGATPLASTEVWSPVTKTWSPGPVLHFARVAPVVSTFADGSVLVAGGASTSGPLASSELLPAGGTSWQQVAPLPTAVSFASSSLLRDGRLLVAGGRTASGGRTSAAEIYNPATRKWTATAPMPLGVAFAAAATLTDGRVLVAGGNNGSAVVARAETWSPVTGRWTGVEPMAHPRLFATAVPITADRVLVTGGSDRSEAFDGARNRWVSVGDSTPARQFPSATTLADGRVVVLGGSSATGPIASAQILTPTRLGAASRALPDLPAGGEGVSAALLPDGRLLVGGGDQPAAGSQVAFTSTADASVLTIHNAPTHAPRAVLPIIRPVQRVSAGPGGGLAFTGAQIQTLLTGGILLLTVGFALTTTFRRRRRA